MRNFGQGKQKGKGFSEITYQGSHPARQHLVPWGPKVPDCRPATDLDDLSEMLSTRNFVAFFFLLFLEPHPWHMEVPRPGQGFQLQLQLPAYTTATAKRDLSHIFDLHHSSWQRWISNPLSVDRDRTHILMDTSQVYFQCTTGGTSKVCLLSWAVLKDFQVHPVLKRSP